jgi:RHS repeat-associated protein
MKTYILSALVVFITLTVSAQNTTNYEEITLQGTPIKVTDRKQDKPPLTGGLLENQLPQMASANAGSSGGSAISETMGDLSVSLTGGATYTVPISVPPGINGVVPTIALSYNSQGGNGLAGYGWNVSGVSIISRIPSTKYHDANIDPVDFDNLDRFALDGQRLILKSGTYGGSGALYETENFSNLKITSLGVSAYGAAYGPASFRVDYPDGSVGYYGLTATTQSKTDFAITRWVNPQGAHVEYGYTTTDNSLSIASIKYGHRTGGTAPNTINFVYKTRKRAEQAFIGGTDFRRKTILSEIKVLTGTTGYRNYLLGHTFNSLGYERLTSITEKSGDNSLNFSPISFSYGTETPSTLGSTSINTTLSVSNIEQRNANVVPLDYTGNGKMDFIVYPKNRADRTKLWIFKDIYSGSTNIGSQVTTSVFENMFPVSYLNAANKLDRAQGFALVAHTGTNEVRFKVNGQSTYGPAAQYYEKIWNAPSYSARSGCTGSPTTYRIPLEYLSGDFNGDGLSDVIAISKPYSYSNCVTRVPTPTNPCGGGGNPLAVNPTVVSPQGVAAAAAGDCCECSSTTQSSSTVYFVNLDRRLATGFANTAGGLSIALKSTDRLVTADVNGDGKTDILQFTLGKVYVYTLSASNTLQLLWTTTDTRIKTEYQPMLGDYNGDGKTDFMYPTATNSTTFALFRSTGVQFLKNEAVYPFTYRLSTTATSPVTTYNLVPSDINGDGRTDMLEYKTVTNNDGLNGSQTLSMYFNTFSTATDVAPVFTYITNRSIPGNLNHFPIPVYLTSADRANNNLDFATISNNRVFYFTFGKDNREDILLRSVSNNGVAHSVTYQELDPTKVGLDNLPVYGTLLDQVYPYIDIQVARGTKVVVGLTRAASGTTTIKQVFSYQGAVAHADGLGFMGFVGLARSEWNTGNTDRIWNITKHDILNRGAVTSAYTIPYTVNFGSIPSDYITKTAYINASSLSASKVFKLTNTSNVQQNRLEGTAITNSFLYDVYTNPTKITTDYSGQGAKVIDITYGNSTGSPYFMGRPLTRKETTTINGNAFSSEEQYTYTGNLITTKKTKGNGTQFDTETYTYDVFGNIKTKTTTPYATTSRQVKFDYDTSGRYLLKSYDVENLTTTFEYNTTTGTLKKETNSYGLITQYFYDGWNRLTKVTDYLGKNANTTYVETSNAYTVTVTADDGGSKITNYDPLKRAIKVSQKDVLGQWVSKSYQYDKFDRVWKESEPYIGTAATQWNTTEYDLYGRPKTVTSYTGKVTTITYTNQSVAVNDGTKTVTTTKNALGNVTQVTDPGGTINYTYFGNGAMKNSTYGGVTISMEQDGWGRKTKLIDPSAGTYSYEYNGFGEMTKEITPKGQTVYQYSTLGKLDKKTVTGDASTNMIINYTYDPVTKLPKTVALATNNDGNTGTTTINYDSFKRVLSTIESSTYTTFTKTYAYDTFGRVDTEENKAQLGAKISTVKTKNSYANGQLKSVKDNATNEELWNITGLNARGQVTTSAMGVAMRRTNTYDASGYLTQALAQKNVTTSAVELMKLTFAFNTQRGILNSRSNGMFAWNETFTYDSQNRLLNFNDNNGAKSHTYDTKGRIDVNSQIGQYKYSTTNFQQTELALNPTGQTYYNNYTAQNITYNSFKSPVEINENGKDRVNFQYNAAMGRATMFYGDTNSDKLLRPFRKHYSSDGSMEIKWEKATGKTTFVTYIGGDGYSSPVIYHSEQASSTTAQYLYLHRDYLGSILAITDKNGNFKEKRHFDAWGNIVKLTDGNNVALTKFVFLDRGYTGHEHLQGVGLVHMNGRLYDPMLHRFLMPDNFVQDPYNTVSYNRYAYVMFNPLLYVDPSGEISWESIGGWIKTNSKAITFVAVVVVAVAATVLTAGMASPLLAGVIVGGAAGFTGGAVGTWTSGGSFGAGLTNGLVQGSIGAIAGLAGAYGGQLASKYIGNVVVNGISSTGRAVKGLLGGAIGGFGGGYAGGVTASMLSGGSLSDANKAGLQSGGMGAVIGAGLGFANGYKSARQLGENPFTGKFNKSVTIGGPQSKVDAFAKDLNSQTITKNSDFDEWPNDLEPYLGQDLINPKAVEFNQKWINEVMDTNTPIYNINRVGNYSEFYHGIEMNSIISRGYLNITPVKTYSFYNNGFRISIW